MVKVRLTTYISYIRRLLRLSIALTPVIRSLLTLKPAVSDNAR